MAVRGGRARLRIERTMDATIFTLKNIPTLLRLGLFPALIALAINVILIMAVPVQAIDFRNPSDMLRVAASLWPIFWVPNILFALAAAVYIVGIHRFILLGERPGWITARFGRHELAFITPVAIFYAAFCAFDLVFTGLIELIGTDSTQSFIPDAIAAVFGVILVWLCLRLLLLASHAAVTGRISPAVSWRAMAGNVWRAVLAAITLGIGGFIVWVIAALPGLLIVGVLLPASHLAAADTRTMLLTMLYHAAGVTPAHGALLAIFAAFLSYAYKDLVEETPPLA